MVTAPTKPATITCDFCKESYDFDDDGYTADCMPDGYILPTHEWICDACGSCPGCGRTLEKEPQKRGPDAVTPRICRYCVMEEANGRWPFHG